MALADVPTLANDPTFQGRVRAASVAFAQVVMGQNPGNFNRVDEKKQALAALVLADGGSSTLPRFAWGIAAKVNSATAPDDATLTTLVQQSWNDLALITGGDLAR